MTLAEAVYLRRVAYALMLVLAAEVYAWNEKWYGAHDDHHFALMTFYQRMVEVG